jgi:hypothetical protein
MSVSGNVLLLCLVGVLLCGCGDPAARNEANPFFKRGMELAEKQQHAEAAMAFRECLRRSPESHKAHLQLAMLCEDHLNDLPAAIVHYRAFLGVSQDEDMNDSVLQWLTRTERRYFDKLRVVYGNPAAHPPMTRPPPSLPVPPPTLPSPISEAHAAAPAVASPPPSHREPPRITGFRTYVVKKGDTLSGIAQRELGNQALADRIWQMNRDVMRSKDVLSVGQKLKLPRRAGEQ